MRKFIILGIIILFTFTGCESDGRVHDKNYLRAVSVNEKSITLSFFNNNGKYITIDTNDLDFAKESAEIYTGKKIFTGYTEMIVVDDKNNIDILEFMLKKWNVSPSCIVAYSKDQKNIFENDIERLTGSIKNAVRQKKAPECDIITVMSRLLSENHSAQIAEISENGITAIHTIN